MKKIYAGFLFLSFLKKYFKDYTILYSFKNCINFVFLFRFILICLINIFAKLWQPQYRIESKFIDIYIHLFGPKINTSTTIHSDHHWNRRIKAVVQNNEYYWPLKITTPYSNVTRKRIERRSRRKRESWERLGKIRKWEGEEVIYILLLLLS